MTPDAWIARPLMALAVALAPASRREWSQAMRQEFDAVRDQPGALSWALGCVATSLGWRLRSEAPFSLAVTVAVVAGWWVSGQISFLLIDWLTPKGVSWMPVWAAAQDVLRGGLCFALALMWPRRAMLTGFALPMAWGYGAIFTWPLVLLDQILADPWSTVGNNPALPNILLPLPFLLAEMWAGLLGAALGAAVVSFRRRRSAA